MRLTILMILILYNLGLLLALVLSAPWWLWQMATTRKYRDGFSERVGFVPARITERLLDVNNGRGVIWLHAVSVGEVLAVSRLVAELDAELSKYQVVISTTTRAGQVLAQERFGADRVFYCPLDLPWAVAAYLRKLHPALLVLAETEFWPNMLTGCFRRGIPVAVVNARISDRSWPRYWRLRGLWGPWLGQIRVALAQTNGDAERLRALGCMQATVSGNLKFDVRATEDAEATRLLRERAQKLRLVVAGSTLEGEEALLLAAWPGLLAADAKSVGPSAPGAGLAMVLAPRHPERFVAVAGLLERSGFSWRRRSEWKAGDLAAGEILLLDSIGELASVYSLAAVAFVGGSLVPAGGHNPLEPAQFGVPVVMGQHYANFRSIAEALLVQEAMLIAGPGVGSTTGPGELVGAIAGLLRNPTGAALMGERGRQVFEAQAGATGRSVTALKRILGETTESDEQGKS